MLGQSDPWKQLCPLILQATSEYSVDGVEQLPRNSNERLETGFDSSEEAFEKPFCVGIPKVCEIAADRYVRRLWTRCSPPGNCGFASVYFSG